MQGVTTTPIALRESGRQSIVDGSHSESNCTNAPLKVRKAAHPWMLVAALTVGTSQHLVRLHVNIAVQTNIVWTG